MANYVLIDSRDLQEYSSGRYFLGLASRLQKLGNKVTIFLVENGALAARKNSDAGQKLGELAGQGVKVYVEDVAARARGVKELEAGIELGNLDQLADLVAERESRVIWY